MRTQRDLLSWPLFLQVPNSAFMWGPTGYDLNLQVTLSRPQSHRVQRCQSSGMAVTVSVEKGWGLHPGMGTRISEEVTTSGPWVLPSLGHASFLLQMGHLVLQTAEWGLDPAFRCSMLSLHSLGRSAAKPHSGSSPFPESSRRHSGNLMQERTRQGIGGGDGDGSVLCTGDRER